VVVLVGFRAIADLWDILGDLSRPVVWKLKSQPFLTRLITWLIISLSQSYTVKHFLARAMCLIALPAALYMAIFYIHLHVLYLTGPGDGHFSSAFQTHLEGNILHNASTPRGMTIVFKLSFLANCVSKAYCIHIFRGGLRFPSNIEEQYNRRRLPSLPYAFVPGRSRCQAATSYHLLAQGRKQSLVHQKV